MQNEGAKKYGNRRATPRARRIATGRYRRCVVDHTLDRDLMADYAAIVSSLSERGRKPHRALYDAAEGYQHPHRWLARRLIEAWMEEAPQEVAERPLLRLLDWVRSLYAARDGAEEHNEIVRTSAA